MRGKGDLRESWCRGGGRIGRRETWGLSSKWKERGKWGKGEKVGVRSRNERKRQKKIKKEGKNEERVRVWLTWRKEERKRDSGRGKGLLHPKWYVSLCPHTPKVRCIGLKV